ncbi:MAG: hypothetical protein IKO19_09655 [Candidatus Riflebacteria bacterium]|nr:hypothetical protein [Candidatus Riflebacteria bacterium]MBR4570908.1 hypothetical protein [Candidatus Riflebacteria bacterium]
MKIRYTYILLTLAAVILLSGFSSEKDTFPAPIKEPAAAVYVNLLPSGIFDEENQKACEDIANNVAKICKLRNDSNSNSLTSKEYRDITIKFIKSSLVSGFLKIYEIYFYYKNPKEYALIAIGEFDTLKIVEKSKAEMIFDQEDRLVKITTSINPGSNSEDKMLLEANNNILVISPERSDLNIFNKLIENKNLLGEKFKTFEQMLKNNPAISAEIDIEQLLKDKDRNNIPKPVCATKLLRLFVAERQNKLQLSIPEENEREEMKKELQKQTLFLNSLFDNKTNYKLAEGKTSIFIETPADEEQIQAISRKAMAFMLHFFVKNISSNQH